MAKLAGPGRGGG